MSPQPGDKVFDFVVSSYTPSLSILARSANHSPVVGRELRLLVVRQPPSDCLLLLQGVVTELEYMQEVIKETCITLVESSTGTVEEVLGLMKEVDWVHFACYDIQDATSPTNSRLCLANERRLKVSDIIALSRSRGGPAFLSASRQRQVTRNSPMRPFILRQECCLQVTAKLLGRCGRSAIGLHRMPQGVPTRSYSGTASSRIIGRRRERCTKPQNDV